MTATRVAAPAVQDLVASARLAQERWAGVPLDGRSRLLGELARAVLRRADEIAATVCEETGKPRTEAIAHELYAAVDQARWLERNLERALRPEGLRVTQPHLWWKRAWLPRDPLGVVGVISPWNLPFALPFTAVATALAAGNGVVLKPSELTPGSGELVRHVVEEAGLPDGLV